MQARSHRGPMCGMIVALVFGAGLCASAQEAAPSALPALLEEVVAKFRRPIPDLEPTPSTLTLERRDRVCRYGNLRMMTGLGQPDGTGLAEDIKAYNATFVTHANGGTAVSFCNRYKTVAEMRQNATERRPVLKIYHDHGVVALPYIDYQRCMRREGSQTYDNWAEIRREWAFLFGDLPERIEDVLEQDAAGAPITNRARDSFTFSAGHPFGPMRALFCVAVDAMCGADGNYFDNHYMNGRGDFNPANVASFRRWLTEAFTAEQRRDLFGTADVNALDPVKIVADRAVGPARVAWMRYRTAHMGRQRERIADFGRSITPHFTMMSTYWSHAGAPFSVIVSSATDIEEMTRDGLRDTLLFWEPGADGPGPGQTYDEARAEAQRSNEATWRFGRRSFSCSLKQMVGASYVPVVSKMAPQQPTDLGTELCMAESYASLVTPRTYKSRAYHQDAIKRMHAFQAAHPDLFLGARPYPRVALLCSTQQAYALRNDADAVPFSRKLADVGLEHQIISDRRLTAEGLAEFDLLIVYRAAMLSDAQIAALEAFSRRGALVIVGEAGTHDEWNRPRADAGRLVGDLPAKAAADGWSAVVDEGRRVAYVANGPLTKWYGDFWYRHSDDGDVGVVRKAVEAVYGTLWPYLATPERPERVEIQLAHVPETGRILVHLVNYHVSAEGAATPSPAFELAVKLEGDRTPTKAFFAAPELGAETRPLAVKVEAREGARYAVLSTPPVRVSAIIALD